MSRLPRLRLAIAGIVVYLSFSGSPAYAYGPSPELVFVSSGALAVHVAAPAALLAMRRFRGRRGRVFGAYAVIMAVYYYVMWTGGHEAMFLLPVFPIFLFAVFYMAVRHSQNHS